MYIILERVFEDGEHIANREIWRGDKKPTHKLKLNQAIFKIAEREKREPFLAFPSAFRSKAEL